MTTSHRVFVTGGAGFIGTNLCQAWLERGASVVAYDDFSAGNTRVLGISHDNFRVIRGGVEDFPALRRAMLEFRPDVVYHLAALHYIPACEADPLRAIDVNVRGTQSAVLAATEADAAQVVLASTSSVYADSAEPYTETYRTAPRDTYGMTKLFAEHLVRHFHTATGRTACIGRFFNVYGPGDTIPHIIPEVLKQLVQSHDQLRLGSLEPRRDFIAVSDLVEALIAFTRLPPGTAEVFNLGSGTDYTIAELVDMIGAALGRTLTIDVEQSRVRRFERPRLASDITKARAAMGWEPKISLREGLARTIAAFPGLGAGVPATSPPPR